MRLKRLELIGFKSFADKAVFDFPGTLTGLVGPNGSGKSNVVDALKWVLGEQSARRLRGVEMCDMIFNGSGGRKPLGSAEVRVTLENTGGLLPIEASEVTISRRCYRTGESEYFINGSLSRLKDIRMLLMDTGVGVSAYSFIEQGQVDMLLRASSKERRMAFDEAAGINRYLQQKKEAERKLEHVQVNLQRVADIIEELERQLRSVRYQAAKARRFKRYADELRQLRIALALHTRGALAREQSELAESIARRDEARKLLDERMTALRQELSSGQQQLEDMQRRLAEAKERLSGIDARHHGLGQEIEMNQGRLAELKARQQELQQRGVEVQADIERVQREIAEAESRLQEGRLRLEERREAQDATVGALHAAEVLCGDLERCVEQGKVEVFNLLQQESQVQNQIGMLSAERQTLEGRLRRQQERLEQLRQQCEEAGSHRAAEEQRLNEARVQLGEVKARLAGLEDDLSKAGLQMDRLTAGIGDLKAELKGKMGRQQVLQDLQTRADGVGSGVKVILEAIAKGGSPLAGAPGLLANQLDVCTRDALAVEAALGDTVQAIVVETKQQARAALRLLQDGRKGRAEVIVLEGIVPFARFDTPTGATRLADLLNYPARIAPVIELVLANCFVVDSAEAALALLEAGVPFQAKLVTRAGECFTSDGVWAAGQPEAGSLISRRSELAQLAADIADAHNRLGKLTEDGRLCAERVEQLQASRRSLDGQREQLAAQENDLRNRLSLIAHQEQQRADELRLLQDEAGSTSAEIEQIGIRAGKLAGQLEQIRACCADKQGQIEALQKELAGRKEEREHLSGELSALRSEIVGLDEQLNGVQTLLDRLHNELGQKETDLRRIGDEQRSSVQAEEEAAQRIGAAQEARAGLEDEKARVHGLAGEMGASCQQAQGHITELQQEADGLAKQREQVDGALNELKMKSSEIRLRLDNLLERTAQESGVNLPALELDPQQWREQPLFADCEIEEFREAAETPSAQVAAWYAEAQQKQEGAAEEQQPTGPKVIKLAEAIQLRDGALSIASNADTNWDEVKERTDKLHKELQSMGGANLDAIREQEELEARSHYLTTQKDDLENARRHELEIIRELSRKSREAFLQTFETVRQNFQDIIRKLFGGGTGDLVLESDVEDVLEAGIDIMVRPPGKEPRSISLLSGGEKALGAVALLFAIFEAKPSPFCLLDEVDAPLDEANVARFLGIVEDYRKGTQFVIVTHNKLTMSAAETLYGISLQEQGVSKKVVVNFEEVDRRLEEMTRETRLAERRAKAG